MKHMDLKGIDHIQMEVRDLDEAYEFWKIHFGFVAIDLGIRAAMRWAIVRNGNGICLSLHENKISAMHKREGTKITHFGLVPENFDDLFDYLSKSGVKVDSITTYEGSQSFYFYDPNGHKVEVSRVWGGGIE